MLEKFLFGVGIGFIAIVALGGISLLLAFPLKWCWNYTMPEIFSLPTITWGKAWCLSMLATFLIKSYNTTNNK